MKLFNSRSIFAVLLFSGAWTIAARADSATLLSQDESARVVAVRKVTVKEGAVSGELVNQSSHPLLEVQLQIRYSWRWNNEFKPGADDPSMTVYYTVEKELPPNGTVPFTYKPSPALPSRADGNFETTVSIAGFTEVMR